MNAILASPIAAVCGGLAGLFWVRGYLSADRRKRTMLWIVALVLVLFGILCPEPAHGDNRGDVSQRYAIMWFDPEWGLITKLVGDGNRMPITYLTSEEAIAAAHEMADAANQPRVVVPIVLPRYK